MKYKHGSDHDNFIATDHMDINRVVVKISALSYLFTRNYMGGTVCVTVIRGY